MNSKGAREDELRRAARRARSIGEIAILMRIGQKYVEAILRGMEDADAVRAQVRANHEAAFVITAFGESKSAAAWAADKRCRVPLETLKDRVRRGVKPENAISLALNEQPSTRSLTLREVEGLQALVRIATRVRSWDGPEHPNRVAARKRDALVHSWRAEGITVTEIAKCAGYKKGTVGAWVRRGAVLQRQPRQDAATER